MEATLLYRLPKNKSDLRKDAYPLPQVQATLDKLRGAAYFSTHDLKNGY
jgi:hypothetical protein